MRQSFGFAALAALGFACSSAAAATLCGAGETIVFSCSTGAHLVSICATGQGALQYRFGVRDHLDIAYPDDGKPASAAFTAGTMMFSGGGGAWLRFQRGPIAYTTFTGIGKWGKGGRTADAGGVAVAKDGAELANFPCRDAPVSELGPDLFAKLGLDDEGEAEPFDIPEAFLPKAR